MLTPEQMEEAVEAMARAVFLRRNGMATCWAWDEGGLDDEHPGAREQYLKDAHAALTAALPVIERAVLERAAQACRDQAKDFLSPQYATGQPISSLGERFACGECERAILALAGEPTP